MLLHLDRISAGELNFVFFSPRKKHEADVKDFDRSRRNRLGKDTDIVSVGAEEGLLSRLPRFRSILRVRASRTIPTNSQFPRALLLMQSTLPGSQRCPLVRPLAYPS